jgi:hypothetical protein
VDGVFGFVAEYRVGILVLLVILIVAGGVTNWLLWMFGWGRYRGPLPTNSKIRFVVADFFVKIINDFRHLLALLIVLLFSGALFIAMWPGMMKQDVTLIRDGLQGVASALSGLLGSVIGYYFGESTARRRLNANQVATPPGSVEQQEPRDGIPGIQAPAKPPPLSE